MIQGDVLTSLDVETLTVLDDALFAGDIQVKGHVAFNEDTVGQAKILAGDTEVRIEFEDEYVYQPVTMVTPRGRAVLETDFKYTIVDETTSGFTIEIGGELEEDIEFNWYAFGSDEGKIFVSDGTEESIEIVVGVLEGPEEESVEEEQVSEESEGEEEVVSEEPQQGVEQESS